MRHLLLALSVCAILLPASARALSPLVGSGGLAPGGLGPSGLGPAQSCQAAAALAERAHAIPTGLLDAIARVESGRADGTGGVAPWPWTINADGAGSFYPSMHAAILAVRALRARGVRSIDIGCMQVSLLHHPNAFPRLADAFDPVRNADYAARFLNRLYRQTGSWPGAVGAYHSFTPSLREDYRRRVFAAWTGTEPPVPPKILPAAAPGPVGPGAVMLSDNPGHAQILPAPPGLVGRGLSLYRQHPILLATHQP